MQVWEQSPATIQDNIIVGELQASTADHAPAGGRSVIRGNRVSGINFQGPALIEGNEIRIHELWTEDQPMAIQIMSGQGWVIRDNTISGYDTAIRGWDPLDEGTIDGNEIVGNFNGIMGAGVATVTDNVLRDHRATALSGYDARSYFEDNVIEANELGLSYRGDPPTMNGNRICDNAENVRPLRGGDRPDAATNDICPDDRSE